MDYSLAGDPNFDGFLHEFSGSSFGETFATFIGAAETPTPGRNKKVGEPY